MFVEWLIAVIVVSVQRLYCFGCTVYNVVDNVCHVFKVPGYALADQERRIRDQEELMENARTYSEWEKSALFADILEGNEAWRMNPVSTDYDYTLVLQRTNSIKIAMENSDLYTLIHLLKSGSLARNFGRINNPKLYTHSRVGTKHAIEDYLDIVCKALDFCASIDTETLDPKFKRVFGSFEQKIDFFKELKQLVGHTAVVVSGGGALGVRNLGVVSCLNDLDLLPRIYSGSSSGSICAAMICAFKGEELKEKAVYIERTGIDLIPKEQEGVDPYIHLLTHIYYTCRQHNYLIHNNLVGDMLRAIFTDLTFIEAYKRTGRVLNISISSDTQNAAPKLLNYITAPRVLLWSAISASSSVPFVFNYEDIYEKDEFGNIKTWNPLGSGNWVDGSVENDLPVSLLSAMFNVGHSITVQNNFFCIPLSLKLMLPTWIQNILKSVNSVIVYMIIMFTRAILDTGISRHPLFYHELNMLSQQWHHDVCIQPKSVTLNDIARVFRNADPDFISEMKHLGEKSTWEKVSIIRNQTMIEQKIDKILYNLKCGVLDMVMLENFLSTSESSSSVENSRESLNPMFEDYDSMPINTDTGELMVYSDYQDTKDRSFKNRKIRSVSVLDALSKRHKVSIRDVRDVIKSKNEQNNDKTQEETRSRYRKKSFGVPTHSGDSYDKEKRYSQL
jgi:predicted acylesterase/phospholipase RssA